MRILYEYKCLNEECELYGKFIERIVPMEERNDQTCSKCGQPLRKLPSRVPHRHISWSNWNVI